MLIEGKEIANELIGAMRSFVDARGLKPVLAIVTMEPDAATEQYLRIKTRVAESCGVTMRIDSCAKELTTADVCARIAVLVEEADGIVVQLPFPPHINIEEVLAAIPAIHDPDCVGNEAVSRIRAGEQRVMHPVVSAIRLIAEREHLKLQGVHAVVIGQGRLVGQPAAEWLVREGARVTRFDKGSGINPAISKTGDIVVLGAGVPGILTKGMIKEGVAIFDAGTSEEGGRLVGDADPECSEKASLMTPVPGGIGPIAVALLFENLLALRFDFGRIA